jgi:hypothetical protein
MRAIYQDSSDISEEEQAPDSNCPPSPFKSSPSPKKATSFAQNLKHSLESSILGRKGIERARKFCAGTKSALTPDSYYVIAFIFAVHRAGVTSLSDYEVERKAIFVS